MSAAALQSCERHRPVKKNPHSFFFRFFSMQTLNYEDEFVVVDSANCRWILPKIDTVTMHDHNKAAVKIQNRMRRNKKGPRGQAARPHCARTTKAGLNWSNMVMSIITVAAIYALIVYIYAPARVDCGSVPLPMRDVTRPIVRATWKHIKTATARLFLCTSKVFKFCNGRLCLPGSAK